MLNVSLKEKGRARKVGSDSRSLSSTSEIDEASSTTHEVDSRPVSNWSEPTDSGTLEPSSSCQVEVRTRVPGTTHEVDSGPASSWNEQTDSGAPVPSGCHLKTSRTHLLGLIFWIPALYQSPVSSVCLVVSWTMSRTSSTTAILLWRTFLRMMYGYGLKRRSYRTSSQLWRPFRRPHPSLRRSVFPLVLVYMGSPSSANQEKEYVRKGTLLALRSLRAARIVPRAWTPVAPGCTK